MSDRYQICVRCIMDTSDPEIDFDAEGVCSHCRRFEEVGRPVLERVGTPEGKRSLADLVERMKERGQGRDYDCVIGVSGGVDSTYVAYAVKTRGLRPLAVHCDTGWNSELAVKNIENIVTRLDIDLRTFVVDWEEMRDLQLAFFKASLANFDILDDHAFLADGLLDLFEATFEPRWLAAALDLGEQLERRFGDPEHGGWFSTAADHERLLVREKPTHDGAEPAGSSVAVQVMLRLAAFTADERWRRRADRALAQAAPAVAAAPLSLHDLLLGVDAAEGPAPEVVLVWPEGAPPPAPWLDVLRRAFLPARALQGASEGPRLSALAAVAPIAAGKVAAGGAPTAYVCERGACRLPVTTPEALAALLRAGP